MKKYLLVLAAFVTLVSPLSAQVISNNKVLTWSTSAGQNGTMKIVSVNGQYFEAEQTNERNRAAGVIKLYGAMVDSGRKIVLINTGQWKEVWEGTITGTEINGNLFSGSSKYTFKIGEQAPSVSTAASTAPFVQGKTLKWSTNAGQAGTVLVTSVTGTKFTLDQVNNNNRAAGTTKLEGEIKDGKIYIYNRQWNETWVGTYAAGKVTGKINNRYTFTITE